MIAAFINRYEPMCDCPACFESSGHPARIVNATYWEPSYAEPDYDGYLNALDAELSKRGGRATA